LTGGENDDGEPFDQAAYVLGSRYRKVVIEELQDGPTTPSDIADRNDMALSHISRALAELREKEVVASHSDSSRTKIYTLTALGIRVAETVAEFDQGGEADG